MHSIHYNGPSGITYFDKNHLMDHRFIHGFHKTEDLGNFELTFFDTISERPIAFPIQFSGSINDCDYISYSEGIYKTDMKIVYIGFAFSLTGSDSQLDLSLLFSGIMAIIQIHEQDGILGYFPIPYTADCKSDVTICIENIGKLLSNPDVCIIMIGRSSKLSIEVERVFPNPSKLIYTLSYKSINFCSNSQIHFSITESQIARAAFYMSITLSNSYFIIYSAESDMVNSSDMLQSLYVQYKANLLGNVQFNDMQLIMRDISVNVPRGAVIVNMLNSEDSKEFFKNMCSRFTDNPYIYLTTFMNVDAFYSIPSKCTDNSYRITSFDPSIRSFLEANSDSTIGLDVFIDRFSDLFSNEKLDRISPEIAAVYGAIITFAEVARSTLTFDIYSLKSTLIERMSFSPAGSVIFESDYYVSRSVYLIKYVNNVAYTMKSSILRLRTEIFLPFDEKSVGLSCELNENLELSVVTKPFKKIIFYHIWDIENPKKEILKGLLEESFIIDMNRNKYINDYILVPILEFHSLENNELLIASKRNVDDESILISFGCTYPDCRSQIESIFSNEKQLLLYTGNSEGERCEKYIISIGTEIMQRIIVGVDFLVKSNLMKYLFVGDGLNFTKPLMKKTEEYIISRGLTSLGICRYSIINEQEEFTRCFNQLGKDVLNSERFAVMSFYRSSEFLRFSEVITDVVDLNLIRLSFVFFENNFLSEKVQKSLAGSIIISSYYPSIQTTTENLFHRTIDGNIIPGLPLTEEMEYAYAGLELFSSVLLQTYAMLNTMPTTNHLRIYLINSTEIVPSGELKITTSLYSSRCMYIIQLNSDLTVNQLFPTSGSLYIQEPTVGNCVVGRERQIFVLSKLEEMRIFLEVILFLDVATLIFVIFGSRSSEFFSWKKLLNVVSVLGMTILTISAFLYTFPPTKSTSYICDIRRYTTFLGFILIFSPLIIKAQTVSKLFNNNKYRKIIITPKSIFQKVLICILLNLLFFLIWFFAERYHFIENRNPKLSSYDIDVFVPDCSFEVVSMSILVLLDFIICLYGLSLSYRIRNISIEFTDYYSFTTGLLVSGVAGLFLFGLELVLPNEPQVLMFLRCILLGGISLYVLLVQYGNRILNFIRTRKISSQRKQSSQSSLSFIASKKSQNFNRSSYDKKKKEQELDFLIDIQNRLSPKSWAEVKRFNEKYQHKN